MGKHRPSGDGMVRKREDGRWESDTKITEQAAVKIDRQISGTEAEIRGIKN